ncbi:MAG TPA: RdgB/HAM1 family non-canonical purine NTP pyrophosphatase [Clostridiales bacterium]|nr:RdgB/HAM1 family non-canonical purine NTP pyrophosphatase [Clostridiales bacterium]
MKFILASHNKNKIKEFREILKDTKIELISLIDLNDNEEIIETGNTFLDNALLKAKHISKKYNLPTIADDSGIEIKYLKNAPGIYSARYSSSGDLANNLKVLKELEGVTDRYARFICVIAVYYPNDEYKSFKGVWEGFIANTIKGNNGFGYDPIFIPNGYRSTVAELDENIKAKLSHRAKALQLLKDEFII